MTDKTPIYLDYAASTPCEPSVIEAMAPFFRENCANASNTAHVLGVRAFEAIEVARTQAANLISSLPQEIVWTSGATESNNLAIQGVAKAHLHSNQGKRGHIVTALHEHKSVLATCQDLQQTGIEITYLKPNPTGVLSAEMVEDVLQDNTFLVSIMWANNELGTINEIRKIGKLCQDRDVIFHCDGAQWVGKMPVNVQVDNIDLLSWSSHKIYGPKGVGALYIRASAEMKIESLFKGGGHENGLRSGSLNVPGIVGFGVACEISRHKMREDASRLGSLRDKLEGKLTSNISGCVINGQFVARLPYISSITFPASSRGKALVEEITEVACSSGAACGSRDLRPSHVLRSIGLSPSQAKSTLRFSLGRDTTTDQIEVAAEHIIKVLNSSGT